MTRHRVSLRAATPVLSASLACLVLSGCGAGSWFGDKEDKRLPGERISVLQMEAKATPDPLLAGTAVVIPPQVGNSMWPQAGGTPDHAMGNLALSASPAQVWTSSIGSGSSGRLRLLSRPLVAMGKVFALDASSEVSALEESSGKRLWTVALKPEETRGSSFGGGIAFGEDLLFAATGYAEVIALNPQDGSVVWRKRIPGPARGAPTVVKGRVFAQTLDNQTFAFSAKDGEQLWSHTGILETAGLLGSVSPAANNTVVVTPYSSGELFALRVENGRTAWQDNLTAARRIGALSGLADIRGMPVIDRGLVLAVSHSGRTVAIDERTGARIWDQDLGGVDTPWPAGEFVFELSNENELVALARKTGRIRWTAPLPRYEDPEDKTSVIVWTGPVLAGDKLWLTGSTGELIAVSPLDGRIVNTIKLPDRAYLPPVVANNTLYVLTDGGTLAAYR